MIINFSGCDFEKYWEQLINDVFMTPFYSNNMLSYLAQRPKDEGLKLENISFIMLLDNNPVAGFIGATVEKEGYIKVLAYEMPALFVENSLLTKKGRKQFLQEFDRRINDCDQLYLTDLLPQGKISKLSTHLLNSGAKPTPRLSQVIDLTEDKTLLWRRIRKSYSSLINNGLRNLELEIVDSKTITWEKMQKFRDLHIREAGRDPFRRKLEATIRDGQIL